MLPWIYMRVFLRQLWYGLTSFYTLVILPLVMSPSQSYITSQQRRQNSGHSARRKYNEEKKTLNCLVVEARNTKNRAIDWFWAQIYFFQTSWLYEKLRWRQQTLNSKQQSYELLKASLFSHSDKNSSAFGMDVTTDSNLNVPNATSSTRSPTERRSLNRKKRIVLIGGGHSHVYLLNKIGSDPYFLSPGKVRCENENESDVEIVLITRTIHTPYSGMLPGFIAGRYTKEDCHIDLERLCTFANIELIHADAIGLDQAQKFVRIKKYPSRKKVEFVKYDTLSINIGSSPRIDLACMKNAINHLTDSKSVENWNMNMIGVKPIDTFCDRWESLMSHIDQEENLRKVLNLVVIGGGAAGVEVILSMEARLRQRFLSRKQDFTKLSFHLVTDNSTILPSHNVGVQRIFMRILRERGIQVTLNCSVVDARDHELLCRNIPSHPILFDYCFWCTTASCQSWIRHHTSLQLDDHGFIAVQDTLQSTSDAHVFAAGDCATIVSKPCPKAGVFAVRQGPPLARNLLRLIRNEMPLEKYVPQMAFLGLLTTGDGNCVASKGNMAVEGAWLLELKEHIDKDWLKEYQK